MTLYDLVEAKAKLVEILEPDIEGDEKGLIFEIDGDCYTVFVNTDDIVYSHNLINEDEL